MTKAQYESQVFEPRELVINDWTSRIVPHEINNRFYVYLKGEFEGCDAVIEADNYQEAFEKFLIQYKMGSHEMGIDNS